LIIKVPAQGGSKYLLMQLPIADNTGVAVALLGQLYFGKARIQN
jgi:hypothetical protein